MGTNWDGKMFHINGELLSGDRIPFNMRRKLSSIVLIGLLLCILNIPSLYASAESSNQENVVTISEDETWNSDQTISGVIEITQNGNLTIDSSIINVDHNTSIVIAEGGVLSFKNSKIIQSNYTSTAISTIMDTGELYIPAGVFTGTWVVNAKLIFAEMNVKPEVKWKEDSDWNTISTNNITVTTSFSEGDEGKWLQIRGSPFEHPVIETVEIRIDDNDQLTTYDPWEMVHEGFMPTDSNNSQFRTWNIINGGVLNIESTTISGAMISGNGEFNANNSWLNRSAPIQLTSTSIFNINGGGINGSATDEDITSVLGASIHWSNTSMGTGGLVDRWTTELGYCQKLVLPAEGIQIEIQNLSYQGTTVNRVGTSASDGTFTPISCDFNFKRLIEIVDSTGNVWTENASIISVIWENSWGTYYGLNGSLGWGELEEISFQTTPHVDITNIILEDKVGSVTDSVEVTIQMKNSGNARAIVPIECKLSDGTTADISPQFPTVSIDPGETGDVFVDWRIFNPKSEQLTCNPMLPSEGNLSNLLGGGSSTSETFTWNPAPAEVENGEWMSTALIIAIFVGIALSVGFLAKQKPDEILEGLVAEIENE